VTVADLSPEQLRRDREASERHGLAIEIVELDMLDLSPLNGRFFDLVYQPVSAAYVPDVRRLYSEVARVTRPGGYYFVEHYHPVHVQMPESGEWDGEAYRIIEPQVSGRPLPQTNWEIAGRHYEITTWLYIHPLEHLIGGLCDAGFIIDRFEETSKGDLSAEPGSLAHKSAYIPSTFAMFARRDSGNASPLEPESVVECT